MVEPKKRGRRRNAMNPKIAESDRIIARTVHQLSLWAFPVRKIFEEVGRQARDVLGRHDNSRQPLGPDRVKQIYENWRKAETKTRQDRGMRPLQERWRYTKDSLHDQRPKNGDIACIAADVLRNQGSNPYPKSLLANGDLILSPKASAQLGDLSEEAMEKLVGRVLQMWRPTDMSIVGREFYEQLIRRSAGLAYRAGELGKAPESLKRGN